MKILKGLFLLSLSLSFLFVGMSIFTRIHCRQLFWHQGLKSISNNLVKNRALPQRVCRKALFSNKKEARSFPYRLKLNMGEAL